MIFPRDFLQQFSPYQNTYRNSSGEKTFNKFTMQYASILLKFNFHKVQQLRV